MSELTKINGKTLAFQSDGIEVTQEQYELIKNTVCAGATEDEMKLHFFNCARRGVHPLDKLIHFIVHTTQRDGRVYTPVTSIDFFRKQAESSGCYAGSDDAVIAKPDGGTWTATVTVWKIVKGTRCPFTATARWNEYCPKPPKDMMWKKMPHTMLAKCAEALALRKGFPGQLHGLYITEEMEQAGDTSPAQDAPVDETAEVKAVIDDDQHSEDDFQKTLDEEAVK